MTRHPCTHPTGLARPEDVSMPLLDFKKQNPHLPHVPFIPGALSQSDTSYPLDGYISIYHISNGPCHVPATDGLDLGSAGVSEAACAEIQRTRPPTASGVREREINSGFVCLH